VCVCVCVCVYNQDSGVLSELFQRLEDGIQFRDIETNVPFMYE
jgi:hypothetical protein